jgi:hypothetical protein
MIEDNKICQFMSRVTIIEIREYDEIFKKYFQVDWDA